LIDWQILYYVVEDDTKLRCSLYMRFYHVCNLIITINSASNFVIYCLFRRQFQRQLRQLVSGMTCGRSRETSVSPGARRRLRHGTTSSTSFVTSR